MSFRRKLAIWFSGVLVLTLALSLTNWWGMGGAIGKLKYINNSTLQIERQLNTIIREKEAFLATEQQQHSRAISSSLAEIRSQLEVMIPLHSQNKSPDSARMAIQSLLDFEKNFTAHNTVSISLKAMKSRMLAESQRLLALSDRLVSPEHELIGEQDHVVMAQMGERGIIQSPTQLLASKIINLITIAVLAEKDVVLFGRQEKSALVFSTIKKIIEYAHDIEQTGTNNEDKLNAFRISKVASIYLETFGHYEEELQKHGDSEAAMQNSLAGFSANVLRFLESERNLNHQRISHLQIVSIVILALAVCFGIVGVYILSGLIARPVRDLRDSAQQIVNGNYDTSVVITSSDDIGELGNLFNKMTKKLKESFHEINEYQDHLERLVQQRTSKLEKEIAERKLTMEALRSSNERLANIIDQSPIGIAIYDNDFRLIEWNPGCEKIFGYPKDEVIGHRLSKIIPLETQGDVEEIIKKVVRTGESSRNSNDNITKDGQVITCDWYNTPLTDSSDKVIGMLSLVENVTDKIRLEKELLKVKKLESTGVLAGGIAHDFNNILTAILGNINLSLLDDSLSETTKKTLASAEKATIRAQSMTQQLLTFAKGGEPVKEETSVVEVIRDSAEFVIHGTSTTIDYHFHDGIWLIDADKGQLSQVIQNIVLNASQAMPGGGNIDIGCENVGRNEFNPVMLSNDMDYVKITIADNGVGIPENVVEKIFDPYFSTKQKGSGLGLAVTLSIINKHNGHITVSSDAGYGTVFTIYLPASSEKSPAIPVETQEQKSDFSGKVLVMDDELMVLDVVGAMLRSLGHEVFIALDGDQCLQVYKEEADRGFPVDLTIMDLTVPGGKGGLETVKELIQLYPKAQVVVSSGYSNDPVMSSFREYGFCAALSKPYVLKNLKEVISSALDK